MIRGARLRQVQANLIWRADGSLWAGWCINPQGVAQHGEDQVDQIVPLVRNVMAALTSPTQLLGIAERVQARDLYQRSLPDPPQGPPSAHDRSPQQDEVLEVHQNGDPDYPQIVQVVSNEIQYLRDDRRGEDPDVHQLSRSTFCALVSRDSDDQHGQADAAPSAAHSDRLSQVMRPGQVEPVMDLNQDVPSGQPRERVQEGREVRSYRGLIMTRTDRPGQFDQPGQLHGPRLLDQPGQFDQPGQPDNHGLQGNPSQHDHGKGIEVGLGSSLLTRLLVHDLPWIIDHRPITRHYYLFTQIQGPSRLTWLRPTIEPAALRHQLQRIHQRLSLGLPIEPLSQDDILALESRALGLSPDHLVDQVYIQEGGGRHDQRLGDHRYVKITATHRQTQATTGWWQGTLMLSHMPLRFTSPGGGAWFQAADTVNHPVDWSVFIEPIANRDARRRCAQQRRQLVGQAEEYAGDPAGAPPSLQAAIDALDEEQAMLQAFPNEPALMMRMGWQIKGRDRATISGVCEGLKATLEPHGFSLHRPTGGQVDGLIALCPGVTPPVTFDHYPQYLLPADMAAGLPLTPIGVGDPTGIPIGIAPVGRRGACTPVFLDPALGPQLNRSGSMAIFGTLGSGKSYTVKRLILGTLARGHRVSVFDRTIHGEYAQIARLAQVKSRVISLADGAGLDPLRCVPGPIGEGIAVTVLSMIARVGATDPDGIRLAQAVHRIARQGGGLQEVPGVLAQDPSSHHLAEHLDVMFRQPLAKVLLGRPDEDLDDVDYLCFHAPGLSLPDRDATIHAHLAQDILPAQLIGKAIVHLVTAISHHAIMAKRDRFGVHVVDEAWALTSSPAGLALLLDAVRDGRKHNAALWLLSQDPGDIGDPALAHLMGTRMVFRCDQGALSQAASLLGCDEDTLTAIPHLETGQAVMRDLYGRVALVHIGPAGDPEIHAALNTTPSGKPVGASAGGRP